MTMVCKTALKEHQNSTLVCEFGFSGSGSTRFRIVEGARLVVDLITTSVSGGGSVTADLYNAGDGENFINVLSLSQNTVGVRRKVISDFHQEFRLDYNIVGTADFKVVVTVRDNAAGTFVENANLVVDVDHTQGDSVQVGDGVEIIEVNSDGSINVKTTSDQITNPVFQPIIGTIDTGADGYGFKLLGSLTSTDNKTKIKKLYMHSKCSAQIRMLIDGTEVRRKDFDPNTSTAEIIFETVKPLLNGEVLTVEARVADLVSGTVDFKGEIEGFISSI